LGGWAAREVSEAVERRFLPRGLLFMPDPFASHPQAVVG
jgi:hypothetical protein